MKMPRIIGLQISADEKPGLGYTCAMLRARTIVLLASAGLLTACADQWNNPYPVSERDARAMQPDYFLVLPWHFRDNIVQREESYLNSGGKLLFPLPRIEIVGAGGRALPAPTRR